MKKHGNKTSLSIDSLTVRIVDVLEEHGVDHESYTLHEYIDLDALEELLSSGHESIEVRITIEGVQLIITQHGVQTLSRP